MSNDLATQAQQTQQALINMSSLFDVPQEQTNLSTGISESMAIVSVQGSRFRIKHGGEAEPVTDSSGNPVSTLDVIILEAAPNLEHTYYEDEFAPNSAQAPDCHSTDGVRPDPDAAKPQNDLCATCPKAQWGSAVSKMSGKATKACKDSKRIAVVPETDIANEALGGAMMLRVPTLSLKNLKRFGDKCRGANSSYRSIITSIGFDPDAAFPLLTFKPKRLISEAEGRQVIQVYPSAARVLNTPEVFDDGTGSAAGNKTVGQSHVEGRSEEAQADSEPNGASRPNRSAAAVANSDPDINREKEQTEGGEGEALMGSLDEDLESLTKDLELS